MSSYFLYAADDGDDRDILQDVINHGIASTRVVCVEDGYMLLQHLQQIRKGELYPCLIILDAMLPRLTGIETLELLKTDDLYRLIPVIIFSSKLSEADRALCEKLGAEVVDKPNNHNKWQEILTRFNAYADEE